MIPQLVFIFSGLSSFLSLDGLFLSFSGHFYVHCTYPVADINAL